MTPTHTQDLAQSGGSNLVYIREIKADEILAAAPEGALDEYHLTPGQTLYAVHTQDGARLAVLADRDSAFAAAFANELAPVSVH